MMTESILDRILSLLPTHPIVGWAIVCLAIATIICLLILLITAFVKGRPIQLLWKLLAIGAQVQAPAAATAGSAELSSTTYQDMLRPIDSKNTEADHWKQLHKCAQDISVRLNWIHASLILDKPDFLYLEKLWELNFADNCKDRIENFTSLTYLPSGKVRQELQDHDQFKKLQNKLNSDATNMTTILRWCLKEKPVKEEQLKQLIESLFELESTATKMLEYLDYQLQTTIRNVTEEIKKQVGLA